MSELLVTNAGKTQHVWLLMLGIVPFQSNVALHALQLVHAKTSHALSLACYNHCSLQIGMHLLTAVSAMKQQQVQDFSCIGIVGDEA